jgi:hypothetical protein
VLRNVARVAGVATVTAALLTGCLAQEDCGGALGLSVASASCASAVEYDGKVYLAWSEKLPVARGELLGDAVFPTCDDGSPGTCGPDPVERPTRVWAMRGVDPEQVVVGRLEGTGRLVVYGDPDAVPEDYFRLARGAWHLRKQ